MDELREIEIISYLSNPKIRQKIKRRAEKLRPSSLFNETLLNYYLNIPSGYTPETGDMTAYLQQHNCTESQCTVAIMLKDKYATLSKDGINSPLGHFHYYYKKQKHAEALEIYNENRVDNPSQALDEYLETVGELQQVKNTNIDLIDLTEEPLEELIEVEGAENSYRVPSKFKIIQESSAYDAYCKGWVVQVAAPPGVAKTQWMLNEVVFQAMHGFKTVWVALGDMDKRSFVCRIACLIHGCSQRDFLENPKRYITPEVNEIWQNIKFIIEEPLKYGASEITARILEIDPLEFDYDTVVIDYDDNLAPEHDNMFLEGGNSYAEFLRIAMKKNDPKLVFVGCQVKQELWDTEKLPERCSAQSSAKQARLHMMVTINRNTKNPHIGTINIPKQRNGELKEGKYHLEPNGNFRGISLDEYRELLSVRREE